MEELMIDYEKTVDLMIELDNKINYLKNDPNVKLYISIAEERKRLEDEKDRIWALIQQQKFNDCDHIIVYTSMDYDNKIGKYKRNCACIKCGLDTSILEKDYNSLKASEVIMYDYIKNIGFNGGLFTGLSFSLELGKNIYQDLKKSNQNITDEEVVRVLRKYIANNMDIIADDNRRLSRVRINKNK